MKKILSLFMAAVMLVSLLAVNSVGLAPGDPYFEVSNVQGTTGDQVEVAVSLKNSPGFGGIMYDVKFDSAKLKFVSYELDLGSEICTATKPAKVTNNAKFVYAGIENVEGDGVLVNFVFEIIGTEPGTTEIKVVPEEGTSFYYTEDYDEIDFTLAETYGVVTIVCGHTSKTEVPAKSPDCLNAGNNQYFTCDACGAAFKADGTETTVEAETIAALGHDYADATCTAPKTCKVCGVTEGDALGHSFTNYVSDNNATCTADGTKTAKCDRCDVTDTIADTGSVKGHDWADATCTAPKTCKVCGATDGDPLGHSFTNYVSNNDATCTEDGTKTAKCDRCDVTDTIADTGSVKGHDWAAATCTEPKTCKVCGATEGEALGHSYEATWSKGEDGHWHACAVCGDKKDFTAHDFGDAGDKCLICDYERDHVHRPTLVPAVEATCTTSGNKAYYTCSGCEDWFEDFTCNVKIADHSSVVVAALGHDYKGVVTAPTCLAGGYTTYTCSRCGDSYVGDYVDALGHNYVAVVTAPTCTEQGYTTHTCSRCDASYVDSYVDALGHDYVATVTAPTCTEQGYTTHACSRCDASYVDTYVDALGHDFATEWSKGDATGHWHTCTRCDAHDTPVAHTPGPEATEFDPQVCTVCGYVIQPELGHRITMVEGFAATCTEAGQKTYYVCEGCGLWFEDATGNVEITDHDSVILLPSHDWQEATCTAPKTCKVCGETEGEANGHTASEWVSDETSHWKVCTVCEEVIDGSKADHADGNKDGKCDSCGYAMVQNYEVIEGADAKWTVTSGETLTFRADGEFSLFTGVMMDGVLVDPSNYTAVSGSTIVTFKAEYLKTLRAGEHTMTVMFTNGSASANFEIKAGSGSNGAPNTGDNSHFLLWTALLLVSAAGMATLVIAGKKKPYDGKYVK